MSLFKKNDAPWNDNHIEQVARAFLKEPVRILSSVTQGKKILRPGASSGISSKFFLETESFERLVLKEAPPYANTLPFCRATLQFQQHLRKSGLPIPYHLPLLSDSQDFHYQILTSDRMRIFTLQRMAEGADFPCLPDIVNMAIDTLDCLHVSGLSVPTTNLPHQNIFDCVADLLAQGSAELASKLKNEWPQNEAEILALISTFSRHINNYKAQAETLGYFQNTQAVHGDFHLNNLLFNPTGTVSAVLDFDDAKLDNPIQDIARLVTSLCIFKFHIDPQRPLSTLPRSVDLPLLRTILQRSKGLKISDVKNGPFLPTLKCISVQMAFIGLLSGMYGINQLEELRHFPDVLDAELFDLDFAN